MTEEEKKAAEILASIERTASATTATTAKVAELERAQRDLESRVGTASELVHYREKNGQLRLREQGGQPGLLDDMPRSDVQLQIQIAAGARSLARRMQLATGRSYNTPRLDDMLEAAYSRLPGCYQSETARAAIFGNVSGSGQDLLPAVTLPRLEAALRQPSGIAALFGSEPLPPGGSISIPRELGLPRTYANAIPVTVDPAGAELSTYGTTRDAIEASKLACSVQVAEDATEDMILAVLPLIESAMLESIRYSIDDLIINGDNGATHQDTLAGWNPGSVFHGTAGTGTALDHRKLWRGLRRDAFANSATVDCSAAQTTAGIASVIALLDSVVGDRWSPENSGLIIPSKLFWSKFVGMSEFLTMEKVANAINARGINGFGGAIPAGAKGGMLGTGVYTTPFAQMDQAATGLYTGSGSYGSVIAFDRGAYRMWTRQASMVRYDVSARAGTITLVANHRCTFAKTVGSTMKTAAVGYKWG